MSSSFAEHDAFFDDVDPSQAPTSSSSSIDPEADAFFADSAPIDAPADALLRRLRDFTVSHAARLAEVRESMCDTLSEAWHEENDVIAIDLTASDPLTTAAMLNTDNAQFNKVATAIGTVIWELQGMQDIAEARFYGPLTQFGHKYSEHAIDKAPPPSTSTSSSSPTSSLTPPPPTAPFTPPTSLHSLPTLEQEFGLLLPILQDLSNFLTRLFSLASNLLTQLGCLYHERQKLFLSTYRHVRLDCAFDALALATRVCITLDCIINDNGQIEKGWAAYKKIIRYVRQDPAKYDVQVPALRRFESLLLTLDKQILSVSIFQQLLELEYGVVDPAAGGASPAAGGGGANKALIEGNKVLYDQFGLVVKAQFKRLSASLGGDGGGGGGGGAGGGGGDSGGGGEAYDRVGVVDLCGVYALYRWLYRDTTKVDKKLFNDLWLLQRRVPCVYLFGRAIFYIPEFLGKFAAIEAKAVVQPIGKAILSTRLTFLQEHDEAFNARVDDLYAQLSTWLVRMESALKITSSHPVHTVLTTRARLLVSGLLLARSLRELLTTSIYLHLKLNVSFRAKNIRSIAVGCEMLKTIQRSFVQRQGMIAEHFNLIIGQSTFVLKHVTLGLRKKLAAEVHAHPAAKGGAGKATSKSMELDGKLDALAALSLCHGLLEQPPTGERLSLLRLAMSVGLGERMWSAKGGDEKGKVGEEVRYQLWKLQLLSQYQQLIDRLCNCSFLYWTPNLVPVFFSDLFAHPSQVNRLHYLFDAFHDVLFLFAGCEVTQRCLLKFEYEQEVLHYLHSTIIEPLCREVETDLRLHIHSVVLSQMQLRQSVTIRDLSKFLHIQPLTFFSHTIDLRQHVSHYLDWNFYNLNTVALHDWRVYAEMRNLALEKYGLQLNEVHLPGTSHYSESLDILEVMRNIHVFVARYNYNMNTQIFIERAFDQKHVKYTAHAAHTQHTHNTTHTHTTHAAIA